MDCPLWRWFCPPGADKGCWNSVSRWKKHLTTALFLLIIPDSYHVGTEVAQSVEQRTEKQSEGSCASRSDLRSFLFLLTLGKIVHRTINCPNYPFFTMISKQIRSKFWADSVHLTNDGYLRMGKYIADELIKFLPFRLQKWLKGRSYVSSMLKDYMKLQITLFGWLHLSISKNLFIKR